MAETKTKTQPRRKPRNTGDRTLAPQGRLHELDRVIDARDGRRITAEQAILERIRTGLPVITAAGSVGVLNQTFYDWRRRGVRIRSRLLAGEQITDPTEQRFMAFANKIDQAEAEALATDWTRHGLIAAGGAEIVKTIERTVIDHEGHATTTSETRRERALPSERALQWRMSHRWPEHFGDRVEVSGPDGGPVPVEVTAAALAARFRQFVDADATEIDANADQDEEGSGGRDGGWRPASLPPAGDTPTK